MDQPARCGIEGNGSLYCVASQQHESTCLIEGMAGMLFEGYLSHPGSLIVTGTALGLDAGQPFITNSIGYAFDSVGPFLSLGGFFDDANLHAITVALEFDKGLSGGGGGGPTSAGAVSYSGAYANVQAALDALLYVAPQIASFTNNVNTVETGVTITSVALAWTYNKVMTSASLNGGIGSILVTDVTHSVTGSFTTDQTWTLTASDGQNTVTRNTGIAFRQKRYWGVSASTTLDDAAILALGGAEFASNFNKAIAYNATGGKYPYLAYPASFGAPSNVTVGGLAFSDFDVATQSFTNASGYAESYHVLRFNNIQSGANISVVWA